LPGGCPCHRRTPRSRRAGEYKQTGAEEAVRRLLLRGPGGEQREEDRTAEQVRQDGGQPPAVPPPQLPGDGQGGRVHAVVLTGVCQLIYLRSPSGFAWVGQSSAGWHAFAAPPAPEGAASHPRAAKAWHTARHGTSTRRPIHKDSRSGKSTV